MKKLPLATLETFSKTYVWLNMDMDMGSALEIRNYTCGVDGIDRQTDYNDGGKILGSNPQRTDARC